MFKMALKLTLLMMMNGMAIVTAGHDLESIDDQFMAMNTDVQQLSRSLGKEEIVPDKPNSTFVDSQYSVYKGYQQAWRMLGFYVDCSPDIFSQGSQDGDGSNQCQRYLLWAAYIDENYQRGGVAEYSFFDPDTQSYDESNTCEKFSFGRCAPMDCHEPNSTTWKLLGIYKQAFYASEWFEQLFKHEGYCLWDEDTYEFMHSNYDAWPEGCTQSKATSSSGDSLYIDLMPSPGGSMAFALYTDDVCKTTYDDPSEYDTKLAYALASSEYLSGDYLDEWNAKLNVYKYCQPCITYNLNNNGNNKRNRRRRLEDDEDPTDGYYDCDDAAGYTNVNQCMKFHTKTTMVSATIQDLQLAHQQGGIVEISILGHVYGFPMSSNSSQTSSYYQSQLASGEPAVSSKNAMNLLISSIVVLSLAILCLVLVIRWKINRMTDRRNRAALKEPLVTKEHTGVLA